MYNNNIFDAIKSGDNIKKIADYYHMTPARTSGLICPVCGNGSGKHGTGAEFYFNDKNDRYELKCHGSNCGKNFNAYELVAYFEHLDLSTDYNKQKAAKIAAVILHIPFENYNTLGNNAQKKNPARTTSKKQATDTEKIELIRAGADISQKTDAQTVIEMAKRDIEESKKNLRGFIESQGGNFRGLTLKTLEYFGCGFLPQWISPTNILECQQGKREKLPPTSRRFIIPTPNHYNAILLPADRTDRNAKFWKMHTSPKEYFGVNLLPLNVDMLIVVEGEVDAMSIWQATGGKYEVVALGGAGETKLPQTLLDSNFPRKPKILILLDSDEAGRKAAPSLQKSLQENGFPAVAKFLSEDVTKIDTNDILIKQGESVLAEKIEELVNAAADDLNKFQQEIEAKIAEQKAKIQAAIKDVEITDGTVQQLFELRGTDKNRAEQIVLLFGDKLKYIYDTELWARYNAGIWSIGKSGRPSAIYDLAIKTGEVMKAYANDVYQEKSANAFALKKPIAEACALVHAIDKVRIESDVFDKHPMLFPVANGVIDLETGELLPHAPKYFFTKKSSVEYKQGYHSELFNKFMSDILPDENTRRAVLRYLGYCLTGDVREEKALFIQGNGRNGKGTLIKVLQAVFGLYGTTFKIDALLKKKYETDGNAPTPEFAKLEGTRLAVANEIPQDRYLDVAPFKDLTGGDAVSVRQLHQSPRIIQPTWKFIFTGQNLPQVQNINDIGLRERMILVDFTQSFTGDKCDPLLKQKLLQPEVLSGVLSVLVEECIAWQRDGLIFSEAMTEKKNSYIDENDFTKEFISEYCIVEPSKTCFLKELAIKFKDKYYDNLEGMNIQSICKMLKRSLPENIESKKVGLGVKLFGIGLATSEELKNLFSKPNDTDETEKALEGDAVDDDDLPF